MDPVDGTAQALRVEVVSSAAPRSVTIQVLSLAAGSMVRDALHAAGWLERGAVLPPGHTCGIWSRRCNLDQALRDGDRVELYRPLTVDPKHARRLRYKGQTKGKRQVPARTG